eukprot:2563399-Pyramimonas_sp.AAC.1
MSSRRHSHSHIDLQLSATGVSARSTMKGAAKCDKHCGIHCLDFSVFSFRHECIPIPRVVSDMRGEGVVGHLGESWPSWTCAVWLPEPEP